MSFLLGVLATLTNVALLVVLARLVAACTLGMLASLLALADVLTYRLLFFHLLDP